MPLKLAKQPQSLMHPSANVRDCPCCAGPTQRGAWAVVAPFIAEYVKPGCASLVQLLECSRCQHRFFDYAYTAQETQTLYGEYRSQGYFQCRHRHEPWYSLKVNEANQQPDVVRSRVTAMRSFLEPFLPFRRTDLVLADLGGDAGQFIPLDLVAKAFVVEASNQRPVPGVARVNSLEEIPDDVNILVCAHVLEHLPEPAAYLHAQLSSPKLLPGSLIYVEVPLERHGISPLMATRAYKQYLKVLRQIPPLFFIFDFLSVVARSYLGFLLPPLLVKLHEHVNFFTAASLLQCVETDWIEVLACKADPASAFSTHQGVIRLVARKR